MDTKDFFKNYKQRFDERSVEYALLVGIETELRSRLEPDKCKDCPNKEFYEQNTARIMDSVEPDKKSAEEILYKQELKNRSIMNELVSPDYKRDIIYPAMEAYARQFSGGELRSAKGRFTTLESEEDNPVK